MGAGGAGGGEDHRQPRRAFHPFLRPKQKPADALNCSTCFFLHEGNLTLEDPLTAMQSVRIVVVWKHVFLL